LIRIILYSLPFSVYFQVNVDFEIYRAIMNKLKGAYWLAGTPLGADSGRVLLYIGAYGRAMWAGYGVGSVRILVGFKKYSFEIR